MLVAQENINLPVDTFGNTNKKGGPEGSPILISYL